ncbi:MAG TPA: hypothetical protein DDZ76_10080, partial [Xanthomonadales bacterium]|nr:hypothetical protein [Xanthomonadales bacterium]
MPDLPGFAGVPGRAARPAVSFGSDAGLACRFEVRTVADLLGFPGIADFPDALDLLGLLAFPDRVDAPDVPGALPHQSLAGA